MSLPCSVPPVIGWKRLKSEAGRRRGSVEASRENGSEASDTTRLQGHEKGGPWLARIPLEDALRG
jgi:hypothetical protein